MHAYLWVSVKYQYYSSIKLVFDWNEEDLNARSAVDYKKIVGFKRTSKLENTGCHQTEVCLSPLHLV